MSSNHAVLNRAFNGFVAGALTMLVVGGGDVCCTARTRGGDMRRQIKKLNKDIKAMAPAHPLRGAALRKILPRLRPLVGRENRLLNRMARRDANAQAHVLIEKCQLLQLQARFGDRRGLRRLRRTARRWNARGSLLNQLDCLDAKWLVYAGQAARQVQVARAMIRVGAAHPDSRAVAITVARLARIKPTQALARIDLLRTFNVLHGAAVAALAAAGRKQFAAARLNGPMVVSGATLAGGRLSTAQLKGKVVLVDVWATWCPYCIKEFAQLGAEYKKFHHRGLDIVGVSVDKRASAARGFLAQHPADNWPQIWFNRGGGAVPLDRQLGITGLPTLYFIDRKGVVRHIRVGYAATGLNSRVRQLLKR